MSLLDAGTEAANPFIEHPARWKECNGGDQWLFTFKNGYGASVVRHDFSYGGRNGLWELGVLGPDGHLTYKTPITSDVLGHLDDDLVRETLRAIAELPAVAS
jgi:hypothetical protein